MRSERIDAIWSSPDRSSSAAVPLKFYFAENVGRREMVDAG
jgi:hypothetical protein